jgi:lipopolysaccharide export system ATP-binding protein
MRAEVTSILEIKNLVKVYQDKNIVDNLSFEIYPGEIVGLLGPNGAGKTTAFYMTIGLIAPDLGKVFFLGQDVTSKPVDQRAKMGMGYLAQEPSVFRQLTVEENILCFLETQGLPKEEKKSELKKLLAELNLTHLAKKKAALLSGGERRRLEITRALVTKPKLLLLDEPFANVDPITISDVKAMILLLKEKGIATLITDHNAREIFSVVDRSYLMIQGSVMAAGSVEDLMNNQMVKERYLGQHFKM